MKKATEIALKSVFAFFKDFLLSLALLILMFVNQFKEKKENRLPQDSTGIKSLLDDTDIEIPDEER